MNPLAIVGTFRGAFAIAPRPRSRNSYQGRGYAIVALWDDGREIENRPRDQVENLHKARAPRRAARPAGVLVMQRTYFDDSDASTPEDRLAFASVPAGVMQADHE